MNINEINRFKHARTMQRRINSTKMLVDKVDKFIAGSASDIHMKTAIEEKINELLEFIAKEDFEV